MERTVSQSASQSETSTPPRMLAPERTQSSGMNHLASAQNPMAVYNGQSWMFWAARDKSALKAKNNENERPNLDPRMSQVSQISKLTSELALSDQEHDNHDEDTVSRGDRSEIHCTNCGFAEFKVKFVTGEKVLACGRCGSMVDEERGGEEGQVEDRNAYRRFYT
jgi:ribosomal protein S27E